MSTFANTLYVTTQGAYLAKRHENVEVRVDGKTTLAAPFHHLAAIVCFGRVSVSPSLIAACPERGIELTFASASGRFLARVEGSGQSRAALRRAQYRTAEDPMACLTLARSLVLGKIANARATLLRVAREHEMTEAVDSLSRVAEGLKHDVRGAMSATTLDQLRGYEGEAAAQYFSVFDHMIRKQRDHFRFEGRTRRPPKDPMNALLSFLYALVTNDASSAASAAGLDVAIGFLHAERPGRPALALDLAEEFRSFLADRVAVALVNLGQVKPDGFKANELGGVEMDEATRRTVITAYQRRKGETCVHPFTGEETRIGLLLFIQARLLARAIRADLDAYPPFQSR
ncbi:MAG: type I-C CRISPR-associated endonuclease Cas1 [Planctomycetes bacterium]|nr:type I-C CRISPR-associated endonuclease Cas1 [Planctomycetota bacterium]MBI3843133.1 type I-C CRISPR-associated endonuclease Cas1 [Planctomycetota bacterium]